MRGCCCGNLRARTYFILVSALSLATSELLRNLIEAWREDSSWSLSADAWQYGGHKEGGVNAAAVAHSTLMPMDVMHIGHMRMRVLHRTMFVPMRMRFSIGVFWAMRVPMMLVMKM